MTVIIMDNFRITANLLLISSLMIILAINGAESRLILPRPTEEAQNAKTSFNSFINEVKPQLILPSPVGIAQIAKMSLNSSIIEVKPRLVLSSPAEEAQISKMDLNSSSLEDISAVVGYVVENFLDDCGLYLFFDVRNMALAAGAISRSLGRPLTLIGLEWLQGKLTFPDDANLTPYRTCFAYVVLSEDPMAIRTLILSKNFETLLHHLGRYVFVTGSAGSSPKVILENEVMAWRPHAVVVRKINKDKPNLIEGDRRADYEIWSHHVFREDMTERVYLVDRWWQQGSETQRHAEFFPEKLDDFHRNELKAVTFEHPPSIIEIPREGDADAHDQGLHYDGIEIRILRVLSQALNFRLLIVNPSDGGKWGILQEDGTRSGLIGDVIGRRAHMGVANLFIHVHHLQIFDMTRPYDLEFGCFITPVPEDLPQWVALVYPFSREVWIYTLVFTFFGLLLLYLTSRAAKCLLQEAYSWATSLYQSAFYGMGIFLGQGTPKALCSDVSRSYFVMWVWYGVLVTVVYKSSLTAFLTVPLAQPPIDTLEQLMSSSLPAWGSTGITFKEMLQQNADPLVRRLAERYQPVSSATEGILLTAQRKYAMMENRQFLEYMIATNYTNQYGEETLHVMKECFLPFRIGMAMPKKAPYKPNFDRVVAKIVEAGLVGKWLKEILALSQKRSAAGDENRSSGALTLINLEGAWLILGSGFLISVVMFAAEKLIKPSMNNVNTSTIK